MLARRHPKAKPGGIGHNDEPARLFPGEFPFATDGSGARVITNSTGKVLWLSPSAVELTAANRSITIIDGELRGRTRYSDNIVQRLLSTAAGQGAAEELLSPSDSEPRHLYLSARDCRNSDGDAIGIAITIRERDHPLSGVPNLGKLYNLTSSEALIIEKMLNGLSVTQIAEDLHKSVLTVRTHIKRAYVKLNVRTKEQLFANVLRLMVD